MIDNPTPVGVPNSTDLQEYKTAYFASGCFWCVEAIYESVYGVEEVISGYAGGTTVNPIINKLELDELVMQKLLRCITTRVK